MTLVTSVDNDFTIYDVFYKVKCVQTVQRVHKT